MLLLGIFVFFFFFRSSASQQVQMSNDSTLLDVMPFPSFFPCPSSIIQNMSFCLGLPLPLFPSILPSIISLCRELPLKICPIQFFCLVLIISFKDLFFPTFSNTSSFVLCRGLPIYRQGVHIGRYLTYRRCRYIGLLICSDIFPVDISIGSGLPRIHYRLQCTGRR